MVIAKNDFERYEIILPLSALAGRRRKSFLYSELEKMHPCFSDEFCFDSVTKKIGRKGACAEVLVMSKNKLAEYEGKKRFSGNGFKLEGEKHHRFFIDKKFALTVWMIFVCLLVCAGGLLCGIIAGKLSNKKDFAANIEENLAPDLAGGTAGLENAGFDNTDFEGELLIKAVSKAGGKITSFEWSIDGFTETFNASVEGVYPESLEQPLVPQNVSYVTGVPRFTVFSNQKKNMAAVQTTSQVHISPQEQFSSDIRTPAFNVQMRKLIAEKGAQIKEERTAPYRVMFLCPSMAGAGLLLRELTGLLEENQKSITFMRFSPQQNVSQSSTLQVELSIESIPVKGFDLKLIYENLNVFVEEKSINQKIKPAAQTAQKPVTPEPAVNKKLGEIKRPDNTTVVFYKNLEGKMEKMILTGEVNHD